MISLLRGGRRRIGGLAAQQRFRCCRAAHDHAHAGQLPALRLPIESFQQREPDGGHTGGDAHALAGKTATELKSRGKLDGISRVRFKCRQRMRRRQSGLPALICSNAIFKARSEGLRSVLSANLKTVLLDRCLLALFWR